MRRVMALEDAYRVVARRWPRAVLVDGPAVLRSRSRHGILDDRLFHDNVHPTLAAHVALAEAVLARLKARGAFGWPGSIPAPFAWPRPLRRRTRPRRRCLGHGLRPHVRSNEHDFVVPYDPAERLRLRDRYAAAAIRIRTGTRPVDAGIPGLGAGSAESGMISAQGAP